MKSSDDQIATSTQKAAILAGCVVVVNRQRLSALTYLSANRTDTTLSLKHFIILLQADAVLVLQICSSASDTDLISVLDAMLLSPEPPGGLTFRGVPPRHQFKVSGVMPEGKDWGCRCDGSISGASISVARRVGCASTSLPTKAWLVSEVPRYSV